MKSHSTIVCIFAVIFVIMITGGTTGVSASEDVFTCRGDTLVLTVLLLQHGSYGMPVSGQQILFFDQTTDVLLGVSITGSDGIASLPWTVPLDHPLGLTVLNATFAGNESLALAPSCQYAMITVLSKTNIHLSAFELNLAPGDTLTLTALLLDDADVPLPGQVLSVYSKDEFIVSSVTNHSGYAVFAIPCDGSWHILGENEISVHSPRNLSIYTEANSESLTVNILKIKTNLTLRSSINYEFSLGENVELPVLLEGPSPSPLIVYLDFNELFSLYTNEQGLADIELLIDTRFTLGPHIIRVLYPGTERFNSSILHIEINVVSPLLMNLTTQSTLIIGEKGFFEIRLSDILGRPISGTQVTLLDMDTELEYTSMTQTDGRAMFELPMIGKKGIHSMKVYLPNSNYLLNTSCVFYIPVWTQPSLSVYYSNILGFASPTQALNFTLRLTDLEDTYVGHPLYITLWNNTMFSVFTDNNGLAVIWTCAPSVEGNYTITILFHGSSNEYALSCSLILSITVDRIIPVQIELAHYRVVSVLNTLELYLLLRGLNGTFLADVEFEYSWLTVSGVERSGFNGFFYISLPLPSTAGEHYFRYLVRGSDSVRYSVGEIVIYISVDEVLAAQGIGVGGFTASLVSSIIAATVYLIRKRQLI